MKALKIGIVMLSVTLFVSGCNSTQGSNSETSTAEKTAEIVTTTEADTTAEKIMEDTTQENATSEMYDIDKDITNGNISITMTVEDRINFLVNAKADSPDKATVMYLAIVNLFRDNDNADVLAIVNADCGSLNYAQTNGTVVIGSTDENGNAMSKLPDWFNQDLDISTDDNVQCYYDILNVFSEIVSECTGKEFESLALETTEENVATQETAKPVSIGERNALQTAKGYLKFTHFSYEGLIDQLDYEGYTDTECKYGVDNCGANWKEQALGTANDYLAFSSFSYQGLYDQLIYEKYTDEEARYGVDNCGADWNEQAKKTAESYLKFSSFSRQSLYEQLIYEGFTEEQAEYGVTAVGY